MKIWTNRLLWVTYLALLGVLLPHTAWAFGQFEPEGWIWLGWMGAFAFESAIAGLTLRLKEKIEETPNFRTGNVSLRRIRFRYFNAFGLGLSVALGVSALANWAHAVEFGRSLAVIGSYSVPPIIFSLAFGAILPGTSLVFARVLSEVDESEHEANPELDNAKKTVGELRATFARKEEEVRSAEDQIRELSVRLEQTEDLARLLFGQGIDKRTRIVEVRRRWPELPNSGVAVLTDSSPSYVSEVLSE